MKLCCFGRSVRYSGVSYQETPFRAIGSVDKWMKIVHHGELVPGSPHESTRALQDADAGMSELGR